MDVGKQLVNTAEESVALLKEKAPLFLTIGSIGFGIASTYSAVKVTPEAYDIYQRIMSREDLTDQQKKLEIAKCILPLYGPAVLLALLSASSGIFSYQISKNRLDNAYEKLGTLGTAYAFASDGLRRTREEIKEKYGEEAEKDIREGVEEKRRKEAAEVKEKGDNTSPYRLVLNRVSWFLDPISGQYHKTTAAQIYNSCAEIEKRLCIEDAIAASEYFYDVNIKNCGAGDSKGWLQWDEVRPKIDDVAKYDPDLDIVYFEVFLDTNDNYASYVATNGRY